MSKIQPCDVIKMKVMRGEVRKKPINKRWIIPHFYDVTWLIFEKLAKATWKHTAYRRKLELECDQPWEIWAVCRAGDWLIGKTDFSSASWTASFSQQARSGLDKGDYWHGSKGIRQWPVNWCTSPMMIHKTIPSVDYN